MYITKTKHGKDYIVNGYKVKPEVFSAFISEMFTGRGVAKLIEQIEEVGYVIIDSTENSLKNRVTELENEIRELKTGMAKQDALPF